MGTGYRTSQSRRRDMVLVMATCRGKIGNMASERQRYTKTETKTTHSVFSLLLAGRDTK